MLRPIKFLSRKTTDGENLIMPVMKEVVKIMIGEKESEKLNAISSSNNTVKRRKVEHG